jgi:hypothetical protein
VLRWATLSPDARQAAIFAALALLVYVVAILRGAHQLAAAPPNEAQAELLRVAGAGFVLVYFAIEMS